MVTDVRWMVCFGPWAKPDDKKVGQIEGCSHMDIRYFPFMHGRQKSYTAMAFGKLWTTVGCGWGAPMLHVDYKKW